MEGINIIKIALALIGLIIFSSCGESDLTQEHQVDERRVLAIRADLPEAHPGESINLDLLFGVPEGDTTEFHQIWTVCDPGPYGESQTGALICSESVSLENLLTFSAIDSETFQFTIPRDTLSQYGSRSKYLYVLHALCFGTLEQCQRDLQGEKLDFSTLKLSVKRIRVISEDQTITNSNPSLDQIYLNDQPIDRLKPLQLKSGTHPLKASVTASSFEKKINPEGKSVDERITFYWHSNGGTFVDDRDLANQLRGETLEDFDEVELKLTDEDEKNLKIYLITMDERGGVDWRVIDVKE